MMILLTLSAGLAALLLGRFAFGKWFNHVGLYGVVWACSLALFETDVIRYYPLTYETLAIIACGGIGFVFGSILLPAARFSTLGRWGSDKYMLRERRVLNLRSFRLLLWGLNVIVLVDMIHLIRVVSNLIGGLDNYFGVANYLYLLRITGGIPGAIPYLSSFSLAGCFLSGLHTAVTRSVRFVVLPPIVAVIITSVLSLDRGTMIVAAVLFMSGYALATEKRPREVTTSLGTKIRRSLAVVMAIALLVAGLEFVRSNRGIVESSFAAGSTVSRLQGDSFVTPSILFYVTGHFGVLNQYLKKDSERNIVGRYTLAPFWRTLANFGFDTKVAGNQPFYRTPIMGNNGTYLRELHADYGLLGIALGPALLGAVVTFFWFRAFETGKLVDMMILGHLLVVVVMSVFQVATQQGSWLASLGFGIVLSSIIDRMSSSKAAQMTICPD